MAYDLRKHVNIMMIHSWRNMSFLNHRVKKVFKKLDCIYYFPTQYVHSVSVSVSTLSGLGLGLGCAGLDYNTDLYFEVEVD